MDNASDTRQIRVAQRSARLAQAASDRVLFSLMSGPEGRAYVFHRLERSFIFSTPFTGDDARTNFNLGIQNSGLQDLAELMRVCPDQFIQMLREHNDQEIANGRRNPSPSPDSDAGSFGRDSNSGRDDSGSVASEYDPHSGGNDAADGSAEG